MSKDRRIMKILPVVEGNQGIILVDYVEPLLDRYIAEDAVWLPACVKSLETQASTPQVSSVKGTSHQND